MVLQHDVRSPLPTRPGTRGGRPRPDPVRIAGIAGALLLNGAALMLMMAPLSRPDGGPDASRGVTAEWFEPRPVPPPPPPELVPVRPATPATPAPAPRLQRVVPPVAAAVDPPPVDGGTLPAQPPAQAGPAITGAAVDGPGAGVATGLQLAYAEATAPPYPRDALRAGHQGTVLLRVLVGTDGLPRQVEVERSSGYRRLDDAARRHVLRHWRFQPAMRDGRAVEAAGLVPVAFSLDRG